MVEHGSGRPAMLRAIETALLSPPVSILLHGEAGIGKTHLLAEAETLAEGMGYRVLHGQARDFGSGLAYASLTDALGALHDDPDAREPLGELLEAIDRAALGAAGSAPAVRTAKLLERLPGRTLLAIDDLHLADADTLGVLSYLPRRVRDLTVAGTARRPPAMDADLVLRLEPLSLGEVTTLVTGVLGRTPSESVVRQVHKASRGNPWFAREAVLTLVQGGAVRSEDPASRRGAILTRLFQRDKGGRSLARVLAALRRTRPAGPGDLDALAEVAGLRAGEAERAFDGLVRDGIVTATGDGAFEFAHPLVAEALYADLGPAERRRVHARIAGLLERRGLGGTRGVLEWATHMAAGGPSSEALAATLRAAELTRWTAPLSAGHWYGRAAELAPPEERGVLLSREAVAYWKGSRPKDALRAGQEALAVLAPGRRHTRTAQTTVNAAHSMGQYELAVSIAAAQLPAADDRTALLAQQAVISTQLGLDATELAAEAWRALPACPPQDLVIALSALAGTALINGRWEETERALDTMLSAAAALPPAARLSALESAAHLLTAGGVRGRALDLLAQAEAIYRGLGWHDIAGLHVRTMAVVRRLGGDWEQALRDIRSDAVALAEAGLWENLALLRNIELEILLEQGRYDEAERLLADPPPGCVLQLSLRAVFRARCAVGRGDRVTAARLLDEAIATGPPDVLHRAYGTRVIMHAVAGEIGHAQEAATALDEVAKTGTPRARLVADLAVAAAFQDRDRAESALEAARADGLRFEEARARLILGHFGDASHIVRAHTLFTELGATPWLTRAAAALKVAGLAPATVAPLTPADRRVIELVAAGMSNPEIAEELHYSRKTVEVYLTRIYAKTGLRSRVELALAHERGEV
ncbi:LuxR C-terminal-related transcriptional regulator [Sphaerisporangium rubeum]|uniref:DNA-binding CsgD family transcriptional regulator/tetratricopeptide (TPR) repeat protein n=1 Tax=Sphaerisporangium rubeum TaxID=321317 RepID=A0A7X0IHE3_9ACTN|nr:DNA-binding CsgD family transcriptional regulator/tetratricopeptide (TPR) repeat protein [Sphaerisporangium rubeum]